MPLDDATANLIRSMRAAGRPRFHEQTPTQAREASRAAIALVGPGPDLDLVIEEQLPTGGRIKMLRPHNDSGGHLIYVHGGGWVTGSPENAEAIGRELAVHTGMTVVLVGYRLAPEHPHPAALQDVCSALTRVMEIRQQASADDLPLVIAGDSAGGNLATVAVRIARDAGHPRIDLQVLLYPVLDDDFSRNSYLDEENHALLDPTSMKWFWNQYAPHAGRRNDPDVTPLALSDFSGFPPTLIVTAEHDVLRDEGEEYAVRLREAGAQVQLQRSPGQVHGFFTLLDVLPMSRVVLGTVVEAVRALTSSRQGAHR